jgi:hypothetical protein
MEQGKEENEHHQLFLVNCMFGGAAKDVNGLNYPRTTSGRGEQKKRVMHSWNLKESQCNIAQCLDTRDDVATEGGR